MPDTADRYKDYVDRVIPLTTDMAKADAAIREAAVFVNVLSDAQIRLSQCVDAAALITKLSGSVHPIAAIVSAGGIIDLDEVTAELALTQQLQSLSELIGDQLARIQQPLESLHQPFPPGAFDGYDVARVYLQSTTPKIEGADGIYVEGPNPIVMLVTLFKSLWQAVTNNTEQTRIDQDAERLARDRCSTQRYRAFAREAAEGLRVARAETVLAYASLASALRPVVALLPSDTLTSRVASLVGLLSRFADQEVERSRNAARAEMRAQLKDQDDRDEALKLAARANLRLRTALQVLANAPCDELLLSVRAAEADLALAEVMQLDSTLFIASDIRRTITVHVQACRQATTRPAIDHLLRVLDENLAGTAPAPAALAQAPAAPIGCIRYVDGYISFCRELRGFASGGGANTDDHGGMCLSSATLGYSLCGGGGLPGGGSGAGGDAWAIGRALVAAASQLPGAYAARRGEAEGEVLDRSYKQLKTQVDDERAIAVDLFSAMAQYEHGTVGPAVLATVQGVQSMEATLRAQLVANLDSVAPPAGPIAVPMLLDPVADSIAHRSAAITEYEGSPRDLWTALEPVVRVSLLRLGELSLPDRRGLLDLSSRYLDGHGLLNERALGRTYGEVAGQLGSSLATVADTSPGQEVRLQLNRALVGLASSPDATRSGYAAAGLLLAAGSDAAYADGARDDSRLLASLAAEAVDLALGFTPVAGALNDAAQIVHGMVTGRDFAGHPFTTADYALRGLGIVLRTLPAAGAAIQFGGKVLGATFERGCSLLRQYRVAEALASVPAQARRALLEVAESVGEAFSEHVTSVLPAGKVGEKIAKLAIFEKDLVVEQGSLADTWIKLRTEGTIVDDGAAVVFRERSFANVAMPTDGRYARVVEQAFVQGILDGTGTLGKPGSSETFIAAAEDLAGITRGPEIAERLTLLDGASGTFRDLRNSVVVEFNFRGPMQSPVNFDLPNLRDPWWIYGGRTMGNAREWIVQNKTGITQMLEDIRIRPITP